MFPLVIFVPPLRVDTIEIKDTIYIPYISMVDTLSNVVFISTFCGHVNLSNGVEKKDIQSFVD